MIINIKIILNVTQIKKKKKLMINKIQEKYLNDIFMNNIFS